jgi:hypothetical protein
VRIALFIKCGKISTLGSSASCLPGTGHSIWSGSLLCRRRWCAGCVCQVRRARRCCSPGGAAHTSSQEQIRLFDIRLVIFTTDHLTVLSVKYVQPRQKGTTSVYLFANKRKFIFCLEIQQSENGSRNIRFLLTPRFSLPQCQVTAKRQRKRINTVSLPQTDNVTTSYVANGNTEASFPQSGHQETPFAIYTLLRN